VRSNSHNLFALPSELRTTIFSKTAGVANIFKVEFTQRSWRRSSGSALHVIICHSSTGRGLVLDGMVVMPWRFESSPYP